MSVRVQVILEEEEASRFKSQARRESKSLSAWLREAGRKMLRKDTEKELLVSPESLRIFFQKSNEREKGVEPDWEEHKKLIQAGYRAGNMP